MAVNLPDRRTDQHRRAPLPQYCAWLHLLLWSLAALPAADYDELSILLWSNDLESGTPVMRIDRGTRTIHINAMTMRKIIGDWRDQFGKAIVWSDEPWAAQRYRPIPLADLGQDELRILQEVTERFIASDDLDTGVGVPEMQEGEIYIGAMLVDGERKRWLRKVYRDRLDPEAANLVRFVMYLAELTVALPEIRPDGRSSDGPAEP